MSLDLSYPIRRRFTVDEFHRLADAEILGEEDKVELIDGVIVEMPRIRARHNAAVYNLTEMFAERPGRVVTLAIHGPLHLNEVNDVRPDLMLLRHRPDRYRGGLPRAEDVLLLVQVAETSLAFDRDVRVPLYARSGIREYWILDLAHEQLLGYRYVGPNGYHACRAARPSERISPLAFPDLSFSVSDLLGSTVK